MYVLCFQESVLFITLFLIKKLLNLLINIYLLYFLDIYLIFLNYVLKCLFKINT